MPAGAGALLVEPRSRESAAAATRLGSGLSLDQDTPDLGRDALRPYPHLVRLEVAERMGDDREGVIRQATDLGHCLRRANELLGADQGGWHAALLELDAVVHTARGTGASIADRRDHKIAVRG